MRRLRRYPAIAAATLTLASFGLSGCGTALVTNDFAVTIADPGKILPPGPTQVSIFDSSMGSSAEWAQKTMGNTSPGSPYVTSFQTTAGRIIGDTSAAETVQAGLAIPALTPNGYFALNVKPHDGETIRVNAPFVRYYLAKSKAPVEALPLEIHASQSDLTWNLRIVVNVAPDWSPANASPPS